MPHCLVRNDEDLELAAQDIASETLFGTDTETYGLRWNDHAFALQIATEKNVWYFNFHDYGDGTPVLSRSKTFKAIESAWTRPNVTHFIHNAKFDLRRIDMAGYEIEGGVHCTQSCERFLNNQAKTFTLEACLARRGHKKDDRVAAYIKEHKLERIYTDPITGEEYECAHYEKVPFDIMFEYGCIDAEEVRFLGIHQRAELISFPFYLNDLELQKTAYRMERIGMLTRQDYAREGYNHEILQKNEIEAQLSALAGEPFRNGSTWLSAYFDRNGVSYSRNPKTGNPIFDKGALAAIKHPAAGLVRRFRTHEKFANTYYKVYARSPIIHATINLAGTDTGRFSYSDPNLQNVPKEEEPDKDKKPEEWAIWKDNMYPVRGCFAPPEDHCFVMVDFNQQEFRLMLDYAGEHDLIRQINDFGEDVHQATANKVGISRKSAKGLNFGLMYGMGDEALAELLGVSPKEAKAIKEHYFSRLTNVEKVIESIKRISRTRGYIKTWVGRRLYTPKPMLDKETKKIIRFDYKMPNHLIQGGCGDIARMAMPPIDSLLRKTRTSRMLLQVHDELLFQIHKNELELVDPIVRIMENTYRPMNKMKLTCGVDHSWVSWSKKDIHAGKPVL